MSPSFYVCRYKCTKESCLPLHFLQFTVYVHRIIIIFIIICRVCSKQSTVRKMIYSSYFYSPSAESIIIVINTGIPGNAGRERGGHRVIKLLLFREVLIICSSSAVLLVPACLQSKLLSFGGRSCDWCEGWNKAGLQFASEHIIL